MKESARLSAVTIPFKVTDDSSLGANRFIVPLCSSLSSDSRNSHQGVCILGHAWLVPMGMWRGWWLRRCAFPCPVRAIFSATVASWQHSVRYSGGPFECPRCPSLENPAGTHPSTNMPHYHVFACCHCNAVGRGVCPSRSFNQVELDST